MGRRMVFVKMDRYIDGVGGVGGKGVEVRRFDLKRVESELMKKRASTTCRFLLNSKVDFHLL